MNTEEVVAMIDAISDGREWVGTFKASDYHDDLTLGVTEEYVDISVPDLGTHIFRTNDPRIAREIAGALIAWATRQETQQDLPQTEVGRIAVLAAGRGVDANMEAPSNCKNPKVWEASGAHRRKHRSTGECSINKVWREEWYRRNVGRMTLETLKRNRQDEKGILDNTTDKDERADIIRALHVMDDEIYKRDQG